jgi:amidase
MSEPAWKKIAAAKQAEREGKIPSEWRITVPDHEGSLMNLPRECGIFTAEELAITENLDSVELLSKIHSGQLTSLAVTQAFCKVTNPTSSHISC